MAYRYCVFSSVPEKSVLNGIVHLHKRIFGTDDNSIGKMKQKPNLLVIVAMKDERVAGYKMGYELDSQTFYSWLGGVDESDRNQGIASKLMEVQHEIARKNGYRKVRTKTE